MMLGAPVSVSQWLFWNLLPVTLGNLAAGAVFTGVALYATYPAKTLPVANTAQVPSAATAEQQSAFAGAATLHPM
jgi:formate transporter